MARAGVMVDGRRRFSSDPWDGYPAARDRLFDAITSNGLRSCVVLSGDAHTAFVCDLKRDFSDQLAPPIATEFCATSITTRGRPQNQVDAILRDNPHIHFGDSTFRGYVVFDVPRRAASPACVPSRTPPTAAPGSPPQRPSASRPVAPARAASDSPPSGGAPASECSFARHAVARRGGASLAEHIGSANVDLGSDTAAAAADGNRPTRLPRLGCGQY